MDRVVYVVAPAAESNGGHTATISIGGLADDRRKGADRGDNERAKCGEIASGLRESRMRERDGDDRKSEDAKSAHPVNAVQLRSIAQSRMIG
jgi:hypothetical protein